MSAVLQTVAFVPSANAQKPIAQRVFLIAEYKIHHLMALKLTGTFNFRVLDPVRLGGLATLSWMSLPLLAVARSYNALL